MLEDGEVAGFYAPVHRALTEPILLGGAPRAIAIDNGPLAAAIGVDLQHWIAGGVLWLIGHLAAVWAANSDAQYPDVTRRHLRYPAILRVCGSLPLITLSHLPHPDPHRPYSLP